MAFDLHRADGEVIRYGDDARFSFTATGHLVVYDAKGSKTLLSHHSWNWIEPANCTSGPLSPGRAEETRTPESTLPGRHDRAHDGSLPFRKSVGVRF